MRQKCTVSGGLFENLPEMATPVSEASQEWHDARLLRLVEGILYNPERLAAYVAKQPDGRDFLEFVIWRLGGRSQ
jgi:hypothetical protein